MKEEGETAGCADGGEKNGYLGRLLLESSDHDAVGGSVFVDAELERFVDAPEKLRAIVDDATLLGEFGRVEREAAVRFAAALECGLVQRREVDVVQQLLRRAHRDLAHLAGARRTDRSDVGTTHTCIVSVSAVRTTM